MSATSAILPSMLPDLTVRPASAADYEHFVRLFPELGLRDMTPSRERWESVYAPETLFLEDREGVIAYGYGQTYQTVGYVRHVIVDPGQRRAGVGRAVMHALAARFRAAGCSHWCLNVKPENEPALRLYRSLGMEQVYTSTAFHFDWSLTARLSRDHAPVIACPVEPANDAAIEAAFQLPAGQIAAARARPGQILRCLLSISSSAPLGFASFDPSYPGAFPFRVAHPALAAALLDALQPYANPKAPYMQVVVEDDEELTHSLCAAGATVHLRTLYFRGPLPAAASAPAAHP